MIRNTKYIIYLLAILTVFSACNTTKMVPKGQQLLIKNKITCSDPNIDTEPIYNYLKQKENTKTAMLFNFHLWIYNLAHEKSGKKNKIKKWLGIYRLGDIIGEPPIILDNSLVNLSNQQIVKYMRNKGYYESKVKDSIIVLGKKQNKAKVLYRIEPNLPIQIDSVYFSIEDKQIKKVLDQSLNQSLIKKGTLLDVEILEDRRNQITDILKNNGYYLFNKEYVYYEVDTLQKEAYQATLKTIILNPDSGQHQPYKIRDIYFYNNFEPQQYLRLKDSYYQSFDTTEHKGIYFLNRQKKPHIRSKFIAQNIYFNKGDLYCSKNINNTYKQLASLSEYQLINVRYRLIDTLPEVDVLVQLTPFKKHNYTAEVEGTNSSGNLGIGGRLKYQHKSLFGGAEILNTSLYGRLETRNEFSGETHNKYFNSQEVGATISIDFPKFLLPFRSGYFIKKNHPRTTFGLNVNYKTRPEYTRSIYGGSFGYYWVSQRFFKHQLKPLEINAVKVFDMNKNYQRIIQNTHLERSFDDYLISATNYTLRFTTQQKNSDESFFTIVFGAEIAGNFLNMYSKISHMPKENRSYQLFGNTFAQYWKSDLDISFNHKAGRDRIVYRIYVGLAKPYGNISVMPYVKQFYSGGANSIRAWHIRSLGPGSYYNPNTRYYNEVGDFKLEGNLEYRFKLFWLMEGAWFVDMGNTWSTNQKDSRQKAMFDYKNFLSEIAIGSGLGLRFDFTYLIFRIDYGIKIKDPKEDLEKRWLWRQTNYSPFKGDYYTINFGIGYPF